MPALQLPEGCELDEYDTDCTWDELAAKQGDGQPFGVVSPTTFEEGDCAAFLDRNSLAAELSRRVFVLMVDETHVLVFDEHGERIDEPSEFVDNGRQNLRGDH